MSLWGRLSSESTSRGAATVAAFLAGMATIIGLGLRFWPSDSTAEYPLRISADVESVRPGVTRHDYLTASGIPENAVDREYRNQLGMVAASEATMSGLGRRNVEVFWAVNGPGPKSCEAPRLYGSRLVAGRPVIVRPDRDEFTTTLAVWFPAPPVPGIYCVRVSFFTPETQTIKIVSSPFTVSRPPRSPRPPTPETVPGDNSASPVPAPATPPPIAPPRAGPVPSAPFPPDAIR